MQDEIAQGKQRMVLRFKCFLDGFRVVFGFIWVGICACMVPHLPGEGL